MNKYGKAALKAAKMVANGSASSSEDAWNLATSDLFVKGSPSQKKGCPRGAFLGLCEEGLVKGILPGNYTSSVKNKRYAVEAVKILRQNPGLGSDLKSLWKIIQKGDKKSHNSQMDVVAALWNEGLIS